MRWNIFNRKEAIEETGEWRYRLENTALGIGVETPRNDEGRNYLKFMQSLEIFRTLNPTDIFQVKPERVRFYKIFKLR